MSKVDILRLDSVTTNDTKATALINTNFQNIQNVIETLLSRNGATPNYMDAVLDMNSYRIINTAAPTEDFDVVNLKYLRDYVGNLEELVENARQYANTAILNAQNAAGSANVAATASQTALEARDAAVDAAIEVQGIKEDVEGIAQDIEGMIDDPNLIAVGTDLRDPDGKINTVLDGAEVLIDGRYGADLSFSNGELQLLDQNGSGIGSSVEIDVLPSQAGNAGKYLTTDGTDTSWSAITAEGLLTQAQQDAINSGVTSATVQSVEDIEDLIPSQASAQNQLADKEFVNSSIATNTANFIGTFNSVADLEAYTGTVTPNDYAFVIDTDNQGNTIYNRYKYNGTSWIYEYTLNNSSFTAAQWAAINSGITSTDVATIATKQDILVSGTNIKSVNGSSLLGSGNLTIDSLPAQAGNSGKFLTTNGTSASWVNNPDTNPYKGVYDASVTYNRGDYVRYASGNTRYWVCDIDGTVGQTPSEGTYWHAFSDTYHLRADLVTDNANYQLLLITDTNSLQHTGKGKYSPNAPKVNANTGEIIGYAKTTDLPTVNNSQITFTQGGVTKGTITLNQSSDATIALDAGGGSGSVDIDNSTITTNADDEIQAEGTLNHNTATGATNPVYDWVGTTAEYEAQNVATTHPEWICFITDDTTPDVSTLANKDLSNLSNTGKSTAAELSMPSDTYTDLALQASGSSYTAPANGYYYLRMVSTTNANCGFQMASGILGINDEVFQSGAHTGGIIPVKTGDNVSIYYWNSYVEAFRFVYAEGEI